MHRALSGTILAALLSGATFGQSPQTPAAFDSADVHVSPPSTNPTMRGGALRGGRYEVRTATMVDLIGRAYNMEPDKILGGPSWLDSTCSRKRRRQRRRKTST